MFFLVDGLVLLPVAFSAERVCSEHSGLMIQIPQGTLISNKILASLTCHNTDLENKTNYFGLLTRNLFATCACSFPY